MLNWKLLQNGRYQNGNKNKDIRVWMLQAAHVVSFEAEFGWTMQSQAAGKGWKGSGGT